MISLYSLAAFIALVFLPLIVSRLVTLYRQSCAGVRSTMAKVPPIEKSKHNNYFKYMLLGNIPDFSMEGMVSMLLHNFRRVGDLSNFSFWVFNIPFLVINNTDDVAFVLGRAQGKFVKPDHVSRHLSWFVGDSMIVSKAQKWKNQRQLLNPAFHFAAVSSMSFTIIDRTYILIDIINDHIRHQSSIDMATQFQNLTQDILGLVSFGFDFDTQRDKTLKYRVALTTCLDYVRDLAHINAIPAFIRYFIPNLRRRTVEADAALAFLSSSVVKILSARDRSQHNNNAITENIDTNDEIKDNNNEPVSTSTSTSTSTTSSSTSNSQGDLLGFMIDAKEKGANWINQNEIVNEMLLFLTAGSDTTSYLLSSAVYMLIQHPDCAEKLYEEIDRICGPPTIVPTSKSVLNDLPYLDAFICETLRLHPSVPLFTREATENVKLPSGLNVMPGLALVISPHLLHRASSIWGSDSDSFNPDRWLSPDGPLAHHANNQHHQQQQRQREEAEERQQHRKIERTSTDSDGEIFNDGERQPPNMITKKLNLSTVYLPFAAGQRNCIGRNVARLEASLVLAMLCQRFEFSSCPPNTRPPAVQIFSLSMHFQHGLHLQVAHRKAKNQKIETESATEPTATTTTNRKGKGRRPSVLQYD